MSFFMLFYILCVLPARIQKGDSNEWEGKDIVAPSLFKGIRHV